MHEIDFNVCNEIVVTVNHPSNIENSYLLKVNNMVMELSPIINKSVHCSDKLPTKFVINLNNIPEVIDHWIISLAKQIKLWIPRQIKWDLLTEAAYLEEQSFTTQPKIEKQFTVNKLKSKKRRKSLPHRFKMDDKNSIILATPDQRTDLQKLRAIMRKLHCIFSPQEMKFYSKEVQRDLYIPEITSNNVFRGSKFIKALIKHYKQTNKLTLGEEKAIKQTLHDIGYQDKAIDEILNETEVTLESQELDMLSTTKDPTVYCTQYLYDTDDYFVPPANSQPTRKVKNKEMSVQPDTKDTYPALHLNSNHKSHPTTSQHQEITKNTSTNYETGQTGLKISPGQSEILPLENTSQHEISKIHLTLINFIKNGKKKNHTIDSLCKFLVKQERFVSHYFPFKFQRIKKLSIHLHELSFLNRRQRKLLKNLFFITENNPQTRIKITKFRHPWNIVFQNYNL